MVDQLAFWVNQSTNASVSRFNNAATFEHGHFDESRVALAITPKRLKKAWSFIEFLINRTD
jgi:hypothetical protein